MRLIEVKKNLKNLLSGDTIQVQTEQQYTGSQTIKKSRELFSVLEFLSDQPWNDADFSAIQTIIDKYVSLKAQQVTLDQSEYEKISSYVNHVNQRLPVFIGILNSITEEQSPEDINIKLSDSIDSPAKLESLLREIMDLEKYSNIEGKGLKFSGFEKGSNWMVLTAATSLSYGFIMACLKLAQEIMKTKDNYFKTETAKIAYIASLDKSKKEELNEAGFKKYLENYSEVQLNMGAQRIAKNIGEVNGYQVGDIQPKAINTTKSLINIIAKGNEVHLSLSSPKEITESATGEIEVDNSYLTELAKKEDAKQIENAEKDEPPAKDSEKS
jgi:septum formation topological specificity factor MinE